MYWGDTWNYAYSPFKLTILIEQVPLLLPLAYWRGLHLPHGEQGQGDDEMGSRVQVILCRNLFLSVYLFKCQIVTYEPGTDLLLILIEELDRIPTRFSCKILRRVDLLNLVSRQSLVPKLVFYKVGMYYYIKLGSQTSII